MRFCMLLTEGFILEIYLVLFIGLLSNEIEIMSYLFLTQPQYLLSV